jgi:hypothetical protein
MTTEKPMPAPMPDDKLRPVPFWRTKKLSEMKQAE